MPVRNTIIIPVNYLHIINEGHKRINYNQNKCYIFEQHQSNYMKVLRAILEPIKSLHFRQHIISTHYIINSPKSKSVNVISMRDLGWYFEWRNGTQQEVLRASVGWPFETILSSDYALTWINALWGKNLMEIESVKAYVIKDKD